MSLIRQWIDANFRRSELMYELAKVNRCCKYFIIFNKVEWKYVPIVYHFLGSGCSGKLNLFNVGLLAEDNISIFWGGTFNNFFIFDKFMYQKFILDKNILENFDEKIASCFIMVIDDRYDLLMRMYFSHYYYFIDEQLGLLYYDDTLRDELYELDIAYKNNLNLSQNDIIESLYFNDECIKEEVYFKKNYCNLELNIIDQTDWSCQYDEFNNYNQLYDYRYNKRYRGKYLKYLRFMY